MIGAIIGDIVGSRFEFHNHLSKEFEFFHPSCEFTDDTVMTCAVAQALMDCKTDYSDLSEKTVEAMQRIGRQFPDCGYGARFYHWMFSDDPQPYNSFGNGSAMRVSPVGFAAHDVEEAKKLSAAVTCISHNHPEGMKGAEATAVAIVLARQGKSKKEIRTAMEAYYDLGTSVEEYRTQWQGHGREICQVSLPQALVCFFEGESFEDVIRNCISIGAGTDADRAGFPAKDEQDYSLIKQRPGIRSPAVAVSIFCLFLYESCWPPLYTVSHRVSSTVIFRCLVI